jgi:L-asparaginase
MEYKSQHKAQQPRITPRLIIHGGAGNIKPSTVPPEKYAAFRAALLEIVSGRRNPHFLIPFYVYKQANPYGSPIPGN